MGNLDLIFFCNQYWKDEIKKPPKNEGFYFEKF